MPGNFNTKQVIVVRRDLKMRRGKEIAQGSHASIAFLTRRLQKPWWKLIFLILSGRLLTKAEWGWILGSFAKVTLQAQSEEELLNVYEAAKKAGLEVHLITDSGKTEFKGVPTNTTLAIGPDYSDKIDEITGSEGQVPLKLY